MDGINGVLVNPSTDGDIILAKIRENDGLYNVPIREAIELLYVINAQIYADGLALLPSTEEKMVRSLTLDYLIGKHIFYREKYNTTEGMWDKRLLERIALAVKHGEAIPDNDYLSFVNWMLPRKMGTGVKKQAPVLQLHPTDYHGMFLGVLLYATTPLSLQPNAINQFSSDLELRSRAQALLFRHNKISTPGNPLNDYTQDYLGGMIEWINITSRVLQIIKDHSDWNFLQSVTYMKQILSSWALLIMLVMLTRRCLLESHKDIDFNHLYQRYLSLLTT
jgi:hypothetical protein